MKTSRPAVLAVLALLAGGCAGGPSVRQTEMVWADAAQEPAVRFEGAVYGSADMGRGLWRKFQDFVFGRSPDEGMGKPYGMCVSRDVWYVADSGRDRVVVFDWDKHRVWTFGRIDNERGLIEPVNVCEGPDGMLYVADTELGRVVRFDRKGVYDTLFGSPETLESPVGMAFDSRGRLLVVDSKRHEVAVFAPDGTWEAAFGRRGEQPGEFYYPLGIAVAGDGTIYVVDALHFTVQMFDRDFRYVGDFGHDERAAALLPRPRAVDIDNEGRVYVTDAIRHTVVVFDSAGTPLYRFGDQGTGDGQFRLPAGIDVGSGGDVYVVDSVNRRIMKFALLGGSEAL